MQIMIVEANHWAKGATLREAKKAFTVARGMACTPKASVYEVPDDYYIDEYGTGHGSAHAKLIKGKDERRN